MDKEQARKVATSLRKFINRRRVQVVYQDGTGTVVVDTTASVEDWPMYDRFEVRGTVPEEHREEVIAFAASKRQMPNFTRALSDNCTFRIEVPYC